MNLPHAVRYEKTDAGQTKRLEAEVLGLHVALASIVAHLGDYNEEQINKIQVAIKGKLDPVATIEKHTIDKLDQAHALSAYSEVFTDARQISKSK